ncbi:MAG: YceI family protein [Myxococcales bacterium]|nr:YceI family protein [Myxococcales bacterium]MDH3486244.1 YceI family protein [Myxococcales bacterium]
MRAILCVVAVGLVVGCEDPGAKVESATVEAPPERAKPPEAADMAPAKAGRQLSISPENTKIEFVGAKVTRSHEGGFTKFAGTVDLREPIEESIIEVTIDTSSLYADEDKLAKHLKSPDFFDVEKHPSAKFRSIRITKTDAGHTITGDLTLHGVTKSITFPATISKGADGGVSSRAEFAIDRQDFGIAYPGMPDDLIRDKVVIKLDLKLPPQS